MSCWWWQGALSWWTPPAFAALHPLTSPSCRDLPIRSRPDDRQSTAAAGRAGALVGAFRLAPSMVGGCHSAPWFGTARNAPASSLLLQLYQRRWDAAFAAARLAVPASGGLGAPAAQLPAALVPLDEELAELIDSIVAGELRARRQQQQQQSGEPSAEQQSSRGPPHRIPPSECAAFPQPQDCAFLRPGQQFEGRQRVASFHGGPGPKQEHWEVAATVQVGGWQLRAGVACGQFRTGKKSGALPSSLTSCLPAPCCSHAWLFAAYRPCSLASMLLPLPPAALRP